MVLAQTVAIDIPRMLFTALVMAATGAVAWLSSRAVKSIDDKAADLATENKVLSARCHALELDVARMTSQASIVSEIHAGVDKIVQAIHESKRDA